MNSRIFLIFILIFSLKSFSGPSVSGGGDAVVQGNTVRFLDLAESDQVEYFVPDIKKFTSESYYWPRLDLDSSFSPFSESPCMSLYTPLTVAIGVYPGPVKIHVWGTYNYFMAQNLTWAFTTSSLENIKDEGVLKFSRDNIRQLAIQKDDLVIVQKQLFDELSDEDKFAFYTHEALISVIMHYNPEIIAKLGTAPIRTFNRHLIQYSKGLFNPQLAFPLQVLKQSCKALLVK